jgi:hypothetical protein
MTFHFGKLQHHSSFYERNTDLCRLANQYGNSKAVPSMFVSLGYGGTMFFFSAITLIGGIWVWLAIPELAGKSLESIDAVFELPWYLIGRKGKELTKDQGGAVEVTGAEKGDVGMVEDVGADYGNEKRV